MGARGGIVGDPRSLHTPLELCPTCAVGAALCPPPIPPSAAAQAGSGSAAVVFGCLSGFRMSVFPAVVLSPSNWRGGKRGRAWGRGGAQLRAGAAGRAPTLHSLPAGPALPACTGGEDGAMWFTQPGCRASTDPTVYMALCANSPIAQTASLLRQPHCTDSPIARTAPLHRQPRCTDSPIARALCISNVPTAPTAPLHEHLRCTNSTADARAALLHKHPRCTNAPIAQTAPLHKRPHSTNSPAAQTTPLHQQLRGTNVSTASKGPLHEQPHCTASPKRASAAPPHQCFHCTNSPTARTAPLCEWPHRTNVPIAPTAPFVPTAPQQRHPRGTPPAPHEGPRRAPAAQTPTHGSPIPTASSTAAPPQGNDCRASSRAPRGVPKGTPLFPAGVCSCPDFRPPTRTAATWGAPLSIGSHRSAALWLPTGLRARGAAAVRGPGSPPGPDHFLTILPNLRPGNELQFPFNIRLGGDGWGEGGVGGSGGLCGVLGAPQRGSGCPPPKTPPGWILGSISGAITRCGCVAHSSH